MTATLHTLPDHPALWRGDGVAAPQLPGIPTGFSALDVVLPGGGWPVGALTEVFAAREGVGELTLLLPALARLAREMRWIAFVAPPYLPYAPALAAAGMVLARLLVVRPASDAEKLWATRQVLASNACNMVLAWLDTTDASALRRLQLATEQSSAAAVLFRPARLAHQASPAALKLYLERGDGRLAVHVLKRRGARLAGPLLIDVPRPLPTDVVARDLSAQPAAAGISAWYA